MASKQLDLDKESRNFIVTFFLFFFVVTGAFVIIYINQPSKPLVLIVFAVIFSIIMVLTVIIGLCTLSEKSPDELHIFNRPQDWNSNYHHNTCKQCSGRYPCSNYSDSNMQVFCSQQSCRVICGSNSYCIDHWKLKCKTNGWVPHLSPCLNTLLKSAKDVHNKLTLEQLTALSATALANKFNLDVKIVNTHYYTSIKE